MRDTLAIKLFKKSLLCNNILFLYYFIYVCVKLTKSGEWRYNKRESLGKCKDKKKYCATCHFIAVTII